MINQYTFSEKISTIYSLVLTKLFYKKARLIRRPFFCRGNKSLSIDVGFTTGRFCRFDLLNIDGRSELLLKFGKNCKIGDNVHIVATKGVKFGDGCLLASHIFISDTSHGQYKLLDKSSSPEVAPDERPLYSESVWIGDNVWIGENVVILPGVTIASGSILGANSVITKNVPEKSIVVGNPAKIIKRYDTTEEMWVLVKE